MLIIHPIPDYTQNNTHKGASQFAAPLKEQGFNPTVVTFKNDEMGEIESEFELKKVRGGSHIHRFLNVTKEIIKSDDDIVLSQNMSLKSVLWSVVSKLRGKRFIVKADTKGDCSKWTKVRLFLLNYIVDTITVETPGAKKSLKESCPFLEGKLYWLPSGVRDKFKPSDVDKKDEIIFVGRDIPVKNIGDLIEAFESIKGDYPSWTLHIVGSSNPERYGADDMDRVIFEGWLEGEELLQKYRESSIFCLPSQHESFAHVLVEAALTENAIVSTRVGIAPYLLEDAGLFFDKGDVDELADKLRQYIESKEKRRRDVSNLKERGENFYISDVVERFVKKLEKH